SIHQFSWQALASAHASRRAERMQCRTVGLAVLGHPRGATNNSLRARRCRRSASSTPMRQRTVPLRYLHFAATSLDGTVRRSELALVPLRFDTSVTGESRALGKDLPDGHEP